MPSKSTNLNRQQPEKRKRAEDDAGKKKLTGAEKKRQKKQKERAEKDTDKPTTFITPQQLAEKDKPSEVELQLEEEEETVAPVEAVEPSLSLEKEDVGAEKEELVAEENGEAQEEEEEEEEEEEDDEEEEGSSEPLPTKEDIEADSTLKEGARLALYLRFNPSPIYRPISARPKKSMKSAHPLPLDPYAAIQNPNLFQSDYTPAEAAFELTDKQYAQKKKQERLGKAKKGDGVSNERWAFNKARESWLIRRVCDDVQLPTKYFPIALGYLSSVKAPNARADLSGTATDALKKEGEQERRARLVLKMLKKAASS